MILMLESLIHQNRINQATKNAINSIARVYRQWLGSNLLDVELLELLEELFELELETIQFTTLVNDKAALFETQALTLTVGLAQQEHDAPKSSKFALQEATDT